MKEKGKEAPEKGLIKTKGLFMAYSVVIPMQSGIYTVTFILPLQSQGGPEWISDETSKACMLESGKSCEISQETFKFQ